MDDETSDGLAHRPTRGDNSGEELNRLAARAYRPTRIELDDALRHDWLEIWYQPKIDLRRNCLAGAVALARIRHPELGVLLPKSFLSAISETSATHLTEYVLLAALANWSIFDAAGFNLHLAVNVPVGVLAQLPIAAIVEQHRPRAEHWPGLILEVKEDQIVRDLELAQNLAAQLRISGISISIDDFGAGYSSFSRLRELAFAELKLDHSFVKNCAVDKGNAAICRSVIDLAHRLGSAVVAEGIESGADLQALQRMGCDFGQGVLIAPPMPMQGLLDLLHRRFGKPILPAAPADAQPPQTGRALGIDRVA